MTRIKTIVNIKLVHPNAKIPTLAYKGDAGFDLTAVALEKDNYGNIIYHTGIAVEIPEGYVGLVVPKSRNTKKNLILLNTPGIIDSGFRGEILVKYRPNIFYIHFDKFRNWFKYTFKFNHNTPIKLDYKITPSSIYGIGDDIAQLIIIKAPYIEFNQVNELTLSERGTKSYGSSKDNR